MILQIAGALAERGDSLEEVTSAAEKVANSMGKRLLVFFSLPVACYVYDFIPPTVTMGARRSPDSGHFIIGEGKKVLVGC